MEISIKIWLDFKIRKHNLNQTQEILEHNIKFVFEY